MSTSVSQNTQAILLLTAPLLLGRGTSNDQLSPAEYRRLAQHLRELHREPADLLGADSTALIAACQPVVDAARLRSLLERGFLLSQALERWSARAIWVMSRADPSYPRRLKVRLKEAAPAILYGVGDTSILEGRGVAVVGSRHVDDELLDYAEGIGKLAVKAHWTVVSGGARGIDQAAMRGALKSRGLCVGVLADGLEKSAMNREYREGLLERRLVLLSPYDPAAGFNVGNAMQRNKLIYALAEAALVVSSDVEKGGTWAGAVEQLEKLRFVPVYVRSSGKRSAGLEALVKRGAWTFSKPTNADEFTTALQGRAASARPKQSALMLRPVGDAAPDTRVTGVASASSPTLAEPQDWNYAEALFASVRDLVVRFLAKPSAPDEVGVALQVTRQQALNWLERLVEEGVLERGPNSEKYAVRAHTYRAEDADST